MEIQQIEIPGLKDNERAFEVDGTRKVAVKIVRTSESEHAIHLKVWARKITDTGKTVKSAGAEVALPGYIVGVKKDALADGRAEIESVLAQQTTNAISRLLSHEAAMIAWQKIPAEDPEE